MHASLCLGCYFPVEVPKKAQEDGPAWAPSTQMKLRLLALAPVVAAIWRVNKQMKDILSLSVLVSVCVFLHISAILTFK